MSIGLRVGLWSGMFIAPAPGLVQPKLIGDTTITLAIVDDSDPVMTLDALTYTCTVTNTGLDPAILIGVEVTIDSDTTYVGSAAGDFSTIGEAGGVITATYLPLLAPGASLSCTITVTTPATTQTVTVSGVASADNAPDAIDSEDTSVVLVAKDATSGIRCPISATQWTNLRNANGVVGTPDALWLMQEASGDLADSVGTFTLTAARNAVYQEAETGWTRVGIASNDTANKIYFLNVAVGLPDILLTSQAVLVYVRYPGAGSGTQRDVIFFGNAIPARLVRAVSSAQPKVVFSANVSTEVLDFSGEVHPVLLVFDRTNSFNGGLTDGTTRLTAAFNTTCTGKAIILGGDDLTNRKFLYGCSFHAANAEATVTQWKALLQALGWTVSWSP